MSQQIETTAQQLLAYHEDRMLKAEKRGEHYSHGRHEDREEAMAAEHEWRESKYVAEVLLHLLDRPGDASYSHLFPAHP